MASGGEKTAEASGYHVFCVTPQPAGRVASGGSVRQYSTRKLHKKSKSGCTMCKAKRVKCDEERPTCARCRRNATQCSFASTPLCLSSPVAHGEDVVQTDESMKRMRLALSNRSDDTGAVARPLIKSSEDLHLLKHYDTLTSNNLLIGPETDAYHNTVLRLAQSHSYLFHAMLAIAASHLADSNVNGYRQAKHGHLSMALQQFQRAISNPIVKEDSDALLLTSIMINVQYFRGIDDLPSEDNFIRSNDPYRLSWLQVQEGGAALIAKTRPFHVETKVLQYFKVQMLCGDNLRRLPRAMFDLCNVTDEMGNPGVHANPYHDAVHALALLMPWEAGSQNFIKYLHFCGRIYRPFVALVEQNDHRALLVLSWWFALLGGVDMWWSRQRVKRDCLAICAMLDQAGSDGVRELLWFPASICGYPILGRGERTLV